MRVWYRVRRWCDDNRYVVQAVGVIVVVVTLLCNIHESNESRRRYDEELDRLYQANRPRLAWDTLSLEADFIEVPLRNQAVFPAKGVQTRFDLVVGVDTLRSFSRRFDIAGEAQEILQFPIRQDFINEVRGAKKPIEIHLLASYSAYRSTERDTVWTVLEYDDLTKSLVVKRSRVD